MTAEEGIGPFSLPVYRKASMADLDPDSPKGNQHGNERFRQL